MLNMIFNTILRCDRNGLRPLNATSLARVIAVSLDGESQAWNRGKHRHRWFALIAIILPVMFQMSCKKSDMPFDKAKWDDLAEDRSNELRERMINDLRKNHSVIGLPYLTVIHRLGLSTETGSGYARILKYSMSTYWKGIDPVSGTEYWVCFDSNMIAKSDSVYSWGVK